MKTRIFSLLFLSVIALGTVSAQSLKYIHVSGQLGSVINSVEDRKLGIGGTASLFLQDKLFSKTDRQFWTISARAFNNPFRDGKFISSVLNNKYDAFNYIGLLGGYRVSTGDMRNGIFVEPRVGLALIADWKPAFMFSPAMGYAYRGFELGVFGDMGLSGNNTAMGKKNFFTVGVSLGYNFAL